MSARRVDLHCAAGMAPGFDFIDPHRLLDAMDSCGVDHAVLGPIGRWAAVAHEDGNMTLHDWCVRWPARFTRWVTVNPWFPDAAHRLTAALAFDDVVGVKLLPATQGFRLLHLSLLAPILDVVAHAVRPVYVSTGVPVASEPFQLAELARRYPNITFIMGRSGRTDFALDLLPALQAAPNLIAETAYNSGALIRDLVTELGAARVAFASDAPFNDLDLEIDRVRSAGLDNAAEEMVFSGAASRAPVETAS